MPFEAMFNEHDSLHTIRKCQENELLKADLACHTALSNWWLSFSTWEKLFFNRAHKSRGSVSPRAGLHHLPPRKPQKGFSAAMDFESL